MRRPDPEAHRLTSMRTLEVTPRDGAVWLDVRHGIICSTVALRPEQARLVAESMRSAAARCGRIDADRTPVGRWRAFCCRRAIAGVAEARARGRKVDAYARAVRVRRRRRRERRRGTP
ncbi:MAG: hypothetical protein ACK4WH_00865 [Phycisphaerales bacterium]